MTEASDGIPTLELYPTKTNQETLNISHAQRHPCLWTLTARQVHKLRPPGSPIEGRERERVAFVELSPCAKGPNIVS